MAPSCRSQNATSRKTRKNIEPEPEYDHSKDYTGEAPVKKKARANKVNKDAENITRALPKRRRLRGILQKVTETPLDVLFEIFSNLDPLDLLQLSRTSKDLRALLLQRSSTSVWKRARENVEGLPPLPDDLDEPKFAYLAFDKHCTNCLRATKFVQWEFRTKYCRKCLEASASGLFIRAVPDTFSGYVPMFEFRTADRKDPHRYYYVPAIKVLREESESLRDEMWDAWVSEKRAAYSTLQTNARLCEGWSTRCAKDRANELDILRDQRFEKVIERLTNLGWGEEMQTPNLIDELRYHRLVRQTRPLTERAWVTMSGTLIPILERHKADRLKRKMNIRVVERARLFASAYSDATRDVPLLPIFPKAVDAALLEPFSKIVFDTPLDQDITESLKAAGIRLPKAAAEWRKKQDSGLRALMEKAGLKPDLNLATAFFSCNYCRRVCQYPYVLAHRCKLSYSVSFYPEDWKTYALMYMCRETNVPWSASQYTVNGEILRRVQCIIQTCGLNPETATYEDMNSLDCRVICVNCSQFSTTEFVMQWQTAVQRHYDHSPARPNVWKLLDDAEGLKCVKALEKLDKRAGYVRYASESFLSQEKFICSHCKVLRCAGRDLEDHLFEVHNITRVSSDDWDWPVNMASCVDNGKGVSLHPHIEEKSIGSEENDNAKSTVDSNEAASADSEPHTAKANAN
ncbi:uncharacterized protein BT62DRAFT_941002 [Guyanagaster necrorhizus]|uniref:F-box domain-containing protein n=1 Tax=Guyanagaster necrorhizus TaxID=856835 RepID=A0A9P7W4U6_9AGAR|nr:uncharacterized protein BT62DRAFT_941002 [Guyanagaster necrorhizus MCA 3950]KAG7451980.1 hypothetical protein BT62DRAFT_941002 [Guyanagaster necrorhizus MCA 3950]